MLFLSISLSGAFIAVLVFMRNMAGTPSGPAAAFLFSLSMASEMFSSFISISSRSPSFISLISSFVAFAPLPLLNCLLYCSTNNSHISLLS